MVRITGFTQSQSHKIHSILACFSENIAIAVVTISSELKYQDAITQESTHLTLALKSAIASIKVLRDLKSLFINTNDIEHIQKQICFINIIELAPGSLCLYHSRYDREDELLRIKLEK